MGAKDYESMSHDELVEEARTEGIANAEQADDQTLVDQLRQRAQDRGQQ